MKETLHRILMGVIFVPILGFSLVNNDGHSIYFTLIIMVIGMLGYWELRNLFFKKKIFHTPLVPIGIFIAFVSLYLDSITGAFTAILIVFIFESFIQMFVESNYQKSFFNITTSLFIMIYLGLMLGSSILIRNYPDNGNTLDTGLNHYIVLLTGTWMCDIGAYFIGRWFGKHKLNLSVSPNKSAEGFIGGIIVSVISLKVVTILLGFEFKYALLLIPFATIIADLLESLIKRMAGEKDSSHIIPGHGGILDVFDALIITTPLYYLLILM